MSLADEFLFAQALEFTSLYRSLGSAPVAIREARCLELALPLMFRPLEEGDLLAGRIAFPLVGFSPEPGGFGYHCRVDELRAVATRLGSEASRIAEQLVAYWARECTAAKCRKAYPRAVSKGLPSDAWTSESGVAFPLYRLAGLTPDFALLLELGLPGLRNRVAAERALDADPSLREGMLAVLDLLARLILRYAAEAEGRGNRCLSEALRSIAAREPRSCLEAAQLAWLYALASGAWNYGRMDDWLGPFLAADLDAGKLTEAEALDLLCSLWRLMQAYDNQFNNRVYIGGLCRRDESAADRFAYLALEATRRVGGNQPQLSLRFHAAQDPGLMEKALDLLAEGRTFPILYNDDAYLPAAAAALDLPEDEVSGYAPYGCGELVLPGRSVATPSGLLNLLKVLEVSLHGGLDPVTGLPCGPAAPPSFPDFESLLADYEARVGYYMALLARQEALEYKVAGREASFLFMSILHDDCLARGRAILAGGIRHLGGTVECYGNTNVADSLLAIRRLVFEEGRLGLEELVRALDADFAGREELRQALLALPKYGNDNDEADAMAILVHEGACRAAAAEAASCGLDSYLVVVINNWANSLFGRTTGASADGRRAGTPLANANNPAPGMDRCGPTAFLNSLLKPDPALSAGMVQNMKFSKRFCREDRGRFEALLGAWFDEGGAQAMVSVVSAGELEAALAKPEDWGHLMVRVGGFSARYVDLPRDCQLEILARTLHE